MRSKSLPGPKTWRAQQYLAMLVGGFLYAVAIRYFILPSKVILTGTEGISVSVSYFLDSRSIFLPLYIGFQTIILIFGYIKVGRRFALMSLGVVGIVAILVNFLPELRFANPEPYGERLLLVIFAGILSGTAKALTLRMGLSTGDEDVLTLYVAYRRRQSVGTIAFIAGGVAVAFGLTLTLIKSNGDFQPTINQLLYTSIYLFVNAQTLDLMYKRFKLCSVNIITNNPELIAETLQVFSDKRTYTSHQVKGGYSGQSKTLIQAIITLEELPYFLPAIKKADPTVFLSYHTVSGVSGNFHITRVE